VVIKVVGVGAAKKRREEKRRIFERRGRKGFAKDAKRIQKIWESI
jgi:hypothetical protein